MIKVDQSYQVNGSVIAIQSDDTHYYFANNIGEVFDVKRKSAQFNKHPVLDQEPAPLHLFQKGAAFSKSGHILYSANPKGSCALYAKVPVQIEAEASKTNSNTQIPLVNLKTSILLRGHDQRAEVMQFCGQRSQYIFTGGSDGKVYMYSVDSGGVLMSLKPSPDFISHITVNPEGNLLAYASFDKSFILLDIRHQKELLMSYPGDVIEDSAFYKESNFVYAIGREGVSYTYDRKNNIFSKKAIFSSWPSCCVIEESDRFAIVGTRGGFLHIVKLSDNTMLSTFKLDQKGIASLHIDGSKLLVGFETGWTYVIDMYAYVDEFSQAISVKNFKVAKRFLDQNIFLAIHPISQVFEDAWDEILNDILNQLSSGNAQNALEVAAPFLVDEDRKNELNFMVQKQKEFEKFTLAIQNKNFFDAYSLLERNPFLSKTDNARKLELIFIKAFSEAKKMIFADPIRNGAKAQEILKPFSSVPAKKEMMFSLMKHYTIFLNADTFIKEKNFKNYFLLTQEYPFLKNEEMYKKVCTLAESAIKKITLLAQERLYDEAIEGIKQILVFLPYKDELAAIANKIQREKKLVAAIASNSMTEAYELTSAHPELEELQEFIDYEKSFDDTLSKAMEAVSKGEIKQTQSILAPYAAIPIFKPKIRECIRQASYNKIASLLNDQNITAAKTIAAYYLKEFGKDDEYLKLMKKHGLDT
jgi:hypothetical protein